MKITRIICILLLINGCKNASQSTEQTAQHNNDSLPGANNNVLIAEKFTAAFYSFNTDSLKAVLALAESSQPEILYYQKWAECAGYKKLRHQLIQQSDSTLLMAVTVKDDLMGALEIDFNVTDTFHIAVRQHNIISVTTSSNDVKTYWDAKEWVKKKRPHYIDKACEGIWNGGPTPCDCVLGMIKGFKDFVTSRK